jgi:hypothetical protein
VIPTQSSTNQNIFNLSTHCQPKTVLKRYESLDYPKTYLKTMEEGKAFAMNYPSPKAKKRKTTSNHWSIPLTAPAFTPLQEQQERDDLSPKDLEHLRQELYGLDTPPTIPEENELLLVKQMEVCIKDLSTESLENASSRLEAHEYCNTKAYYEALERCPDLVETETNPTMFLRATSYDVQVSFVRSLAGYSSTPLFNSWFCYPVDSSYSSGLSLESPQGHFR